MKKNLKSEPFLPISIWGRAIMITYFVKSWQKQLKQGHFSLISILGAHFPNDKVISPNGNAILQTIFAHAQKCLCQPLLMFSHLLLCTCECGLSFIHFQKCTPFWIYKNVYNQTLLAFRIVVSF